MSTGSRIDDRPSPSKPSDGEPHAGARPREPLTARPVPGSTRCPYCHAACAADADAQVCADCLSRHHPGCWEEASGCASCRGRRSLGLRQEEPEATIYGGAIDAWLRLGLVYNGALTLVTLAWGGLYLAVRGLPASRWLVVIPVRVLILAAIANLFFLIGPGLELTARRLGYRGQALRWFLFVPGLIVALLLACLTGYGALIAPG